jgi:hypothetical protein
MPFYSELDDSQTDCGLWESETNVCEFQGERGTVGACDTSGLYYGTTDSREPKFCARHFYQLVVSGDGTTNYRLIDDEPEH